MMEETLRIADQLCESIRASDVFSVYQRERAAISLDEDLTLRLYRFKKSSAAFRFRRDIEEDLDDEKETASLYHDLYRNPHARAFLDAERNLIDTLSRIVTMIADACDIEMTM